MLLTLAPDHAINTEHSLQFAKLEVKFLIVPLKRALIMTWQGQFACSVPRNLNEAPINYAHQQGNWLVCGQTCTPAEVQPWFPGRLATSNHHHMTLAAAPFVACVRAARTHEATKQCMYNAWWWFCTKLISCLKHANRGTLFYCFPPPKKVPV